MSFFSHFDKCIHDPSWYPACATSTLLNCSNEQIKTIQKGIWLNTWCGGSTVSYVVEAMLTPLHRATYELARRILSEFKETPNPLSIYSLIIGSIGGSVLWYRRLFSHPPSTYSAPQYKSCKDRICEIAEMTFLKLLVGACGFSVSSVSLFAAVEVQNSILPSSYLVCAGAALGAGIAWNERAISQKKQKLKEMKDKERIKVVKDLEKAIKEEVEYTSLKYFIVSSDLTVLLRGEKNQLRDKIKKVSNKDEGKRNYLMGLAEKSGISGVGYHPQALKYWEEAHNKGSEDASDKLSSIYYIESSLFGVKENPAKAKQYKEAYEKRRKAREKKEQEEMKKSWRPFNASSWDDSSNRSFVTGASWAHFPPESFDEEYWKTNARRRFNAPAWDDSSDRSFVTGPHFPPESDDKDAKRGIF